MFKNTVRYALFGIGFGLCFPVVSIIIDITVFNEMQLSMDTIVIIHRNNPMHYIIDSAPLFLGIAFGFSGRNLDKYDRLNIMLKDRIKQQTMSIVEQKDEIEQKNRDLYLKYQEVVLTEEEVRESQEELLQTFDQLNEYKDELEKKVLDRTKELSDNMVKLKTTARDLKIAKKQAERANEAKSQFMANMSHEIRSPLNAIVGFAQLLELRMSKENIHPDLVGYINNVKISGKNLSELINNILDLSKIEAGKMELSMEAINIKQLFKNIYHINKERASSKEIKFSYDLSEDLPDFVETDRTKVNQILMNVVSNAIKFTPREKKVKIHADAKDQKWLIFKIMDEGIGISEDKQKIIFNPFEQADNTITREFGGTGLGLAITKKMVELLSGSITLKSVENEGAEFTIKIPLHPVSAIAVSQNIDLASVHFAKDHKILLVEDNLMNQNMMKKLLQEFNLHVDLASNGTEAIDMAVQMSPDLILMDMHMPQMDGTEATKAIRQINTLKKIPIIAISADAFEEKQKAALKIGVNDYLTKPIDLNKLIDTLQKYLK